MEGKDIQIFGDGNQLRDYLYVADIVSAMLAAGITEEANGEVFNLGSGKSIRFCDMAQTVIDTIGNSNLVKVPWPDDYKIIEGGDFECDISKARELLNWQPKYEFADGLKKTVEFYDKYKNYYWEDDKIL